MKLDKEDIDWGKLRLIVAKIKLVFGVTEGGIIKWNDSMVKNYVSELRKVVATVSPTVKSCMNEMKKVAAPASCKENRGDSIDGLSVSLSESPNPNSRREASGFSAKQTLTLSEANPPSLTKSDSLKRKRELPAWMTRAAPNDNSKRMKSNSLFK